MDTFMDKLAQRLTAQEMIKANTAAEMEEVNGLREQVKDYQACLEKMQGMVDESMSRIQAAKTDSEENAKTIRESLAQLTEAVKSANESNASQNAALAESLKATIEEKLESLQKNDEMLASLKELIEEKLEGLKKDDEGMEQLKQLLTEKLEGSQENVHKECVKVYRNVQAAVVEENGKQTTEIGTQITSAKKKMNSAIILSALAFLAAVAGVVFQVLVYFYII